MHPLQRALRCPCAQVASGQMCDGKTIMLLQYAKLHGLMD